jgi:SH3-like domain-containing protein
VCGTLLPAPGFFCVLCEPPEPPEPNPEKGLNTFQTFLRIALLVLIFIVVVVVKLEINLQDPLPQVVANEVPLKVAEDEDFKLIFLVKVKLANLRDKPNLKTSKIISKLTQGTQVEIINKTEKWSKIRTKPGKNEKTRIGWVGSKLLDSEIK